MYSSLGIPAISERNNLPVEGSFVAAIKPAQLEINEKTKINDIDKYYFGWLDFYYLSQTVNCREFKGKHFQISGYLKLDTKNILDYNDKLNNFHKRKKIEAHQSKNKDINFSEISFNFYRLDVQRLINKSKIDLIAFIETDNGGMEIYPAINKFSNHSAEWQRLNIEVDIPIDCKAITISTRVEGVGDLYIDDILISERGINTEKNRYRHAKIRFRKDPKLDEMLDLWIESSKQTFDFINMGFEESK